MDDLTVGQIMICAFDSHLGAPGGLNSLSPVGGIRDWAYWNYRLTRPQNLDAWIDAGLPSTKGARVIIEEIDELIPFVARVTLSCGTTFSLHTSFLQPLTPMEELIRGVED